MGVLNCQKCFNNDNKNNNDNEIITVNYISKNKKVIFALDSYKNSVSPTTSNENLSRSNSNYFINDKDKSKKRQIKLKKESSTEEEFIDYNNTIEIPYDDIDSDDEQNKMSVYSNDNQDSLEYYNIRLKQSEELFGCDENFAHKNNSMNIQNKNIEKISNNNIINEEIENNKIINNEKDDLNNFINEQIRETRKYELKTEEKCCKNDISENINNNNNNRLYYPSNYNIILRENCFNTNYQYNFNNYNSDIGYNWGLSNIIDQKIDEENEEYYDQEKKIIDISDINYKYKSSTFSQYEIKNIEQSTIFDNKNSIKSEEIKTRKGTKNEGSNDNINYNFSNNYKPQDDRSAISYEIEYIEENNDMDNDHNNNKIGNEEKIKNYGIKKKNQRFIENIEQKVEVEIEKIRENHNQFIITDAFCDYEPEV